MKYTTLPNTDIKVSKINLGTMTFGEQNTEAEAHQQLDYAVENGVNFIDTAEMYSVPKLQDQIQILATCAIQMIFLPQVFNTL